jgi:hypothetical protein
MYVQITVIYGKILITQAPGQLCVSGQQKIENSIFKKMYNIFILAIAIPHMKKPYLT